MSERSKRAYAATDKFVSVTHLFHINCFDYEKKLSSVSPTQIRTYEAEKILTDERVHRFFTLRHRPRRLQSNRKRNQMEKVQIDTVVLFLVLLFLPILS